MPDAHSDPVGRTIATYDRIVDWYAQRWLSDEVMHESLVQFTDLLPADPIVADLGCGMGRDVGFLVQRGVRAIGVDLSGQMLARARAIHPGGRFLRMDMRRLGFGSYSLDGVWACASLFHIPREEIGLVLDGIHRVLKTNAALFVGIQEAAVQSWTEPEGRAFYFYQQGEFRRTLEGHGFQVLHSSRRSNSKTTFSKPMPVTWIRFLARKA